jgi:hypothetical protein
MLLFDESFWGREEGPKKGDWGIEGEGAREHAWGTDGRLEEGTQWPAGDSGGMHGGA